jgi:integrase
MPSAYHDAKGWTAQFLGFQHRRGARPQRLRIPPGRFAGLPDDDQAELAKRYAAACEAACRLLEGRHTGADVRSALALNVITPDQAEALLRGDTAPTRAEAKAVTLEQAYMAHPSAQRATGRDLTRYLDALADFQTWAGITTLDRLTLPQVQAYVAHLVKRGDQWDTRRHHLLAIRRAAKMGASFGLPDVIAELRLDTKEPRPVIEAWSLPEIATALVTLQAEQDWRACAAIGLGAIVGLRPSELIRLRCGDLRADNRLPFALLPGREHDAKNAPSRRLLPIPPTVARWMRRAAQGEDRGRDAPLLQTKRDRHPTRHLHPGAAVPAHQRRAFTESTLGHWLGPLLAERTGRALPTKTLRKTFATWVRRAAIPDEHRELYLGHETELAQSITGKHYTADLHELLADQLAPTTERIEAALTAALAVAETAFKRASPGAPRKDATPHATPRHKGRQAKARTVS